jgi:hypothetical protein
MTRSSFILPNGKRTPKQMSKIQAKKNAQTVLALKRHLKKQGLLTSEIDIIASGAPYIVARDADGSARIIV